MTAGQRNCYEAIGECLDRYSLDDVVEALDAHVEERRELRNISDKRRRSLDVIAGYIDCIQEKLRTMPRR